MKAGWWAGSVLTVCVGLLQVFCNGEEVLVTGGTKAEYIVDVWAGNHPFYQARPLDITAMGPLAKQEALAVPLMMRSPFACGMSSR